MLEGFKTKRFRIGGEGDVLNPETENEALRELFASINKQMGATKFSSKPLPPVYESLKTSYLICDKLWVRKTVVRTFTFPEQSCIDVVYYDVEVYYQDELSRTEDGLKEISC